MQQSNIAKREEASQRIDQRRQKLFESYSKIIEQGGRFFSDYDEEAAPYNDDCDYCNEVNCF